jgi:hypothetical protein
LLTCGFACRLDADFCESGGSAFSALPLWKVPLGAITLATSPGVEGQLELVEGGKRGTGNDPAI